MGSVWCDLSGTSFWKRLRGLLWTGQPGSVPERELILQYDINDYRNKTELTAMTLFTAVVTAARTFNDILRIEENSKSLSWVMEDAKKLFSAHGSASEKSILELAYVQFDRHLGGDQRASLYKLSSEGLDDIKIGIVQSDFESLDVRPLGVDLRDGAVAIKVEHNDSQYVLLGISSKELSEDDLGLLSCFARTFKFLSIISSFANGSKPFS